MKSSDLWVNRVVTYKGKNAVVKAISKQTGSVTIELHEPVKPYKAHDKLVVMPYDLGDYGL